IPVEDREEGKKVLVDSLKNTHEKGVRTETIKSASTEVKDSLKFSHLNSELKVALYEVAEFAIAENSFFDVEKTAKARKEAESNVEPVVIRAGEIIIREGQTITNEKYDELILVGLLNKERNIYPIIGLSILIICNCLPFSDNNFACSNNDRQNY